MKRHGGSGMSCDNAVALLGGMAAAETTTQSALHVINEQLQEAVDAPKCHRCGCLQQTVEALAQTEAGQKELAAMLTQARGVFVTKKYDCLVGRVGGGRRVEAPRLQPVCKLD